MDIYVGNLSWDTTVEDLKKSFAKFGKVVYTDIIKEKTTGKSKGHGFVGMMDDDKARAAIASLNGRNLNGCLIEVRQAQIRTYDRRSSSERRNK